MTRRWRAYGVAAAVLLAMTGCADEEPAPELPEPEPEPSPAQQAPAVELTADEQQAVDEVDALVDEFLTTYQEILAEGAPSLEANLGRLPELGGILLTETWEEVDENFHHNRRGDGEWSWSLAEVVEVDMDRIFPFGEEEIHMPTVRAHYCLDATGWELVDLDNGEPLGVDQDELRAVPQPGERHLVWIEATYWDSSQPEDPENPVWQLELWENQVGEPC